MIVAALTTAGVLAVFALMALVGHAGTIADNLAHLAKLVGELRDIERARLTGEQAERDKWDRIADRAGMG